MFGNNTIITGFFIYTWKYYLISKPQSVESLMGILPVQIKKTVIIVFISQELKRRKKMASLCNEFTLQWLQGTASGTASHSNGCVAFLLFVYVYKPSYLFLDDKLYRKIPARRQNCIIEIIKACFKDFHGNFFLKY